MLYALHADGDNRGNISVRANDTDVAWFLFIMSNLLRTAICGMTPESTLTNQMNI